MDFRAVFEKYAPLLSTYRLPLVVGLVGLIFFVYGLISLLIPASSSSEELLLDASSESIATESASESSITIDIEGEVINPGVYSLPADARVQDALAAAGGLSENANREYIAKTVNLAAKLQDGAKLYFPSQSESASTIQSSNTSSQVMGSATININQASHSELDALPGIGPVTSQKIIDNRPYTSVDELLTKKILGQKVFTQVKEKLSVF